MVVNFIFFILIIILILVIVNIIINIKIGGRQNIKYGGNYDNPLYYKEIVNPGNIIDGHCRHCAFNTCLLLLDYDFNSHGITPEAFAPNSPKFKIFGDWFIPNIEYNESTHLMTIQSNGITNINEFKEQLQIQIAEKTNDCDVLLINIDSAHFISAINKDGIIYFIDAQSGSGFTYTGTIDEYTTITVIKVDDGIITKYEELLPQIIDASSY